MMRHLLLRFLSSSSSSSSSSHILASSSAPWKPDPRHSLWSWPLLPITPFHQVGHQRMYASKLKKYKIKAYSSFKERFKTKANGEVKRWKAGKRHNAHSKTNKQLRQLRQPTVVHPAYAAVMKKLNFLG